MAAIWLWQKRTTGLLSVLQLGESPSPRVAGCFPRGFPLAALTLVSRLPRLTLLLSVRDFLPAHDSLRQKARRYLSDAERGGEAKDRVLR